MQIRLGYELDYSFPQPTPMILTLSIHYSRASDIVIPDYVTTDPPVPIGGYRDGFGNWCTRIVAPRGRFRIKTDALIRDSGQPDSIAPDARQHAVQDLPEETLVFLLGSRYCETDLLSQTAWDLFGQSQPGWARVQAVCNYVHNRIAFDYQRASAHPNGLASLERGHRCVSRLRTSCHRILPLPELSGALLYGLSRRYGDSAALRRRGFRGVV